MTLNTLRKIIEIKKIRNLEKKEEIKKKLRLEMIRK